MLYQVQEILFLDVIELMHHMLVVKFVTMDMHYLQTKPAMIAQKMMLIVLIVQMMDKIIINA